MARWGWYCAMALVSDLWFVRVASAADQEALFAEGTLTSVDLSQKDPAITLRRSSGNPLILQLGRFGEWGSLKVGTEVKLRYTEQGGAYTVESMQITRPVHVEQPPKPFQAVGEQRTEEITPPSTANTPLEQGTTDKLEKKKKKKP